LTNPLPEQLKEAKKEASWDYHAILLLYFANHHEYGKRNKEMENDVLKNTLLGRI